MQARSPADWDRPSEQYGSRPSWGAGASTEQMLRRSIQPEERGSFGKPLNPHRSTIRGKSTPIRTAKEDAIKQENIRTEDAIFSKLKEDSRVRTADRERLMRRPQTPITPTGGSFNMSINDVPAANQAMSVEGEPTEVLLYGFEGTFQWAAVEFYERVSGGVIYEDYERAAPGSRFTAPMRSLSVHVPPAGLRKKNQLRSGDSWVKVTFNSQEAADQACRASPHVLHGFVVRAEIFNGRGPDEDVPCPATSKYVDVGSTRPSAEPSPVPPGPPTGREGLGRTFSPSAPSHVSSSGLSLSIATDTDMSTMQQRPRRTRTEPASRSRGVEDPDSATTPLMPKKTLRLEGAKLAKLLSAEEALLPVKPAWQQMLQTWPLIGHFFSDDDIIGGEVPRTKDGSFDWESASFYWRFWAYIDYLFDTNFCGLRAED